MSKRQHGKPLEFMPAPWSHLPPPEASTHIIQSESGKNYIPSRWRLEVPVTNRNIPIPRMILQMACETLHANYTFPPLKSEGSQKQYNDHHTAYPANHYYRHRSGSKIPGRYRDTGSLIMRVPIQMHNYIHAIFELPPAVDIDVMEQWVREQDTVDALFVLGKRAIRLSRSSYEQEQDESLRRQLISNDRINSGIYRTIFYQELGATDKGELGLLPDVERLRKAPFAQAVRELGTRAGSQSVNYSRHTYSVLRRHGVTDNLRP